MFLLARDWIQNVKYTAQNNRAKEEKKGSKMCVFISVRATRLKEKKWTVMTKIYVNHFIWSEMNEYFVGKDAVYWKVSKIDLKLVRGIFH